MKNKNDEVWEAILRDGVNHVDAELDAAVGVVGAGLRDAAHAVVAVAQQLDAEAVMLRGQLVEPGRGIQRESRVL